MTAKASVVIPSNRPAGVIRNCLDALAVQDIDPTRFEVLVVFNGVGERVEFPTNPWPFRLIVDNIPRAHIGAAKNVALERARGEFIVLLNDDVVPRPEFLRKHIEAHERLDAPAMVLGASPWRRPADETLLDRMIASTSMIFFYDQMRPSAWYNFRHAWNLNLSVPRRALADERFDESLGPFFFEDLELAFRLETRRGTRVWYAADAVADHDHRYTVQGCFEREHKLGAAALDLWRSNAACFHAVYGRTPAELVNYFEVFVEHEGRGEAERVNEFAALTRRAIGEFRGDEALLADTVRVAYRAHLPLKRLAFRRGFVKRWRSDASVRAAGAVVSDSSHASLAGAST